MHKKCTIPSIHLSLKNLWLNFCSFTLPCSPEPGMSAERGKNSRICSLWIWAFQRAPWHRPCMHTPRSFFSPNATGGVKQHLLWNWTAAGSLMDALRCSLKITFHVEWMAWTSGGPAHNMADPEGAKGTHQESEIKRRKLPTAGAAPWHEGTTPTLLQQRHTATCPWVRER